MIWRRLGSGCVYGLAGIFAAAFAAINLAGIITLIVFIFSPLAFADNGLAKYEEANAQCLSCHSKQDLRVTRDDKTISLYVDAAKFKESIHGTRPCTGCHGDLGGVPHTKVVYGKELADSINTQCKACHDDVAKIYDNSVHGEGIAQGARGAYCQDCHGTHEILQSKNPDAQSYRLNIPETCVKCHQGGVEESYNYSFHGSSLKLGYEKSATCTDCHGSHQILSQEDPGSSVNKANLPQTCAQCHLQAQTNFANGQEHVIPRDKDNAFPLWVIWKIFLGLIVFDVFMGGSIAVFELARRMINAGKKG